MATWPYRWIVLDALPQALILILNVGMVLLLGGGQKKKGYELVEDLKTSEEGKND